MDNTDNNVEAIDLTLSSPEPEPRPRVIPRQSQLPTFFKTEPQPHRVTKHENYYSQSAAPAREATRPQVHPSNSNHIARIINSSNPEILKKVLLELCQMSPALCGAIERGLATHSRNQYQTASNNFTTPQSRPKHHDANQSKVVKGLSTLQREAVQKPYATQPVPRVKRELPVHLSGSDDTNSDSDDDLRVPGSFPRSARRLNLAPMKPLSLSERLARLQEETLKESKRCGQCGDLYVRENDACLYHPGRKIVLGAGGEIVWTCCQRHSNEIGCKAGKHIDQEKHTGQQSISIKSAERSFKRPSASPEPSGMQQKKSRIF